MRLATITIAAALALGAPLSATAQGSQTSGARAQLEATVRNEVRIYVSDADLSRLSTPALLNLRQVLFSNRTFSDKRNLVRSALNDRTLFFPRSGGIALSDG